MDNNSMDLRGIFKTVWTAVIWLSIDIGGGLA
jgi:hypothetical protein